VKAKLITIILILMIFMSAAFYLEKSTAVRTPKLFATNGESSIQNISEVKALSNGKWIRSFRAADGTIYLRKHLKSTDGGLTVEAQTKVDVEDVNAVPESAVFAKKGMFYALRGRAALEKPGVYTLNAWRSTDDLNTVSSEKVTFYVPEGPVKEPEEGVWYGLYVYRTILEMPDGSWLMTLYGNFEKDNLPIYNQNAKTETRFMMRSFVVKSTDQGRTWHYLSSIAVPREGDPIGEGFVEPAIVLLANGHLLSVMRTGHHFPLYAAWSADGGKTWTSPMYTGLDRGVDPNLIRLRDGRIALGWGRRYREGWSKITPQGDPYYFNYPGEGDSNLAISEDNGQTWVNHKIARQTGSTYSTIFEVEPNVIFYQVDQWIWRVALKARSAD